MELPVGCDVGYIYRDAIDLCTTFISESRFNRKDQIAQKVIFKTEED